jgi:hypothetical protein
MSNEDIAGWRRCGEHDFVKCGNRDSVIVICSYDL